MSSEPRCPDREQLRRTARMYRQLFDANIESTKKQDHFWTLPSILQVILSFLFNFPLGHCQSDQACAKEKQRKRFRNLLRAGVTIAATVPINLAITIYRTIRVAITISVTPRQHYKLPVQAKAPLKQGMLRIS